MTKLGDPVFIATARASIALVLESEGKYNEALDLLEKSEAILTQNGKGYLAAVCKSNIAHNCVGLGDFERAIHVYREAIGTFRSYNHTSDFTHAMVSLSEALAINGDLPDALATLNETMPQVFKLGSVIDLPRALLVYLTAARQESLFEDAACILGAYSAYILTHRFTPTSTQRSSHDQSAAATQAALKSRYQHHYDRGY